MEYVGFSKTSQTGTNTRVSAKCSSASLAHTWLHPSRRVPSMMKPMKIGEFSLTTTMTWLGLLGIPNRSAVAVLYTSLSILSNNMRHVSNGNFVTEYGCGSTHTSLRHSSPFRARLSMHNHTFPGHCIGMADMYLLGIKSSAGSTFLML